MATRGPKKVMRPFRSHMCGDTVIVEIGPEHKNYYIHPSLLAEHSEYFNKALNGPWKEAKEDVITLADVDCEAFDIFVEWLYTRNLPIDNEEWLPKEGDHDEWEAKVDTLRIKVCVLGDRLLAPGFQGVVQIDLVSCIILWGGMCYFPLDPSAINYAFLHLPADSPILRILVDSLCVDFKDAKPSEENGAVQKLQKLHPDVLIKIIVRYSEIVNDSEFTLTAKKYYK